MSNELQVFSYKGAKVRTVEIDGEAWFVAKDVCDVLGLTNAREAISVLDEDEKSSVRISDGTSPKGGNPNMNVINEPGLYALVFRSNKAEAKAFARWVRHEVLPAIRKTGSYTAPNAEPLNVRVRVAEVLQRLALQESDKGTREVIMRSAYKYATGEDLPAPEKKAKREHKPRQWTAKHLAQTLGWTPEEVLYRAGQLGIGHMEGETLYFDKSERREFLRLVDRGVERIADGYEYYEGGFRLIHWSFEA